ncbi:MAG TPA: ATP-binding protein [Polyangiaceae bacterium]|nr:ATP-binding protein [Polyangiaceae bacterium]
MRKDLEPQASLPWLVRLRWLSLGGQVVALVCARFWFGIRLSELPLALIIASVGASNFVLWHWLRRKPDSTSASAVVGGMFALDTILLTALLAFSGGAMNPFSVLYLVHITLAAVVLGAGWTMSIAGLCIACFGSLFVLPVAPMQSGPNHWAHHLQGMWVAFTLAAALIAFFVRRVATTISAQREHIAALREGAARNARLASLTTLAAGAAHELGTPLGTIAVAAHEMALAAPSDAPALVADARLISAEVERCHEILAKMGSRAGFELGEAVAISPAELERLLRARFDSDQGERIVVRAGANIPTIQAPIDEFSHSIYALVKNAIDASGAAGNVGVSLDCDEAGVRICVEDAGVGMPSQVLAHAGEPFFTTKDPGRGLGLGLFLTRAFAESQGGELLLESEPGRGTRATLRLPRGAA